MNNLNQLCKDAHATARSKGWYEVDRHALEFHMLMVTEIAEASEEVRNKRPPIYGYSDPEVRGAITDDLSTISELNLKPEGEAIELADLAIRLFDYCGYRNIDLEGIVDTIRGGGFDENYLRFLGNPTAMDRPLCRHMLMVISLARAAAEALHGHVNAEAYQVAYAFVRLENYAKLKGFDLEKAIELKMAYNTTRSHRHGGKAL